MKINPTQATTIQPFFIGSLNGRMNVKLHVNFERAEVGIEGLRIDGVEFALVMLVHETGHEHFHILSFSVRYNDSGFNTRSDVRTFNVELRSQHSSGFRLDPQRSIGV